MIGQSDESFDFRNDSPRLDGFHEVGLKAELAGAQPVFRVSMRSQSDQYDVARTLIIEQCAHPDYRPQLRAYVEQALAGGGQTPHVLEQALAWHARYKREGTMLVQ